MPIDESWNNPHMPPCEYCGSTLLCKDDCYGLTQEWRDKYYPDGSLRDKTSLDPKTEEKE